MITRYGIRWLVLVGLGLGSITGCGSIETTGTSATTLANPIVQGDALQIAGVLQPSSARHVVQNGEQITVGPGGGATLTFADASTIFLQVGTEAVVDLPSSGPSVVKLLKGTVRAQSTSKAFGLQTSDATVMPSASYSIFTVYNTDSRKAVDVMSGAVELRSNSGTHARVTAGNDTSLIGVATTAPTTQVVPKATPVPTAVPKATPVPTAVPEATVAPTAIPEATLVPTAPAAPVTTAITNDTSVSLRSGPNTNTTILVRLNKGIQVSVIGQQNDWVRVRLVDGREGWIFNTFLTR